MGSRLIIYFIPEMHEDRAWHIHGLIKGLPAEYLALFSLEDKLPHKIRNKLIAGESVYNWTAYAEKFGYVCLEHIKNKEAIDNYITK